MSSSGTMRFGDAPVHKTPCGLGGALHTPTAHIHVGNIDTRGQNETTAPPFPFTQLSGRESHGNRENFMELAGKCLPSALTTRMREERGEGVDIDSRDEDGRHVL